MSLNIYSSGDYSPSSSSDSSSSHSQGTQPSSCQQCYSPIGPGYLQDRSPVSLLQPCTVQAGAPESGCQFCHNVLGESSQGSLLGKLLEYYFLDGGTQHASPHRCLIASCSQQQFEDARSMLIHLRECEMSQGEDIKLWCPLCHQNYPSKAWDNIRSGWGILQNIWKDFDSSGSLRANQMSSDFRYPEPPSVMLNNVPGGNQDPITSQAGVDVQFDGAKQVQSPIKPWGIPVSTIPSGLYEMNNQLGNVRVLPNLDGSEGFISENPSYPQPPPDLPCSSLSPSSVYSSQTAQTPIEHTGGFAMPDVCQSSSNTSLAAPLFALAGQGGSFQEASVFTPNTYPTAEGMNDSNYNFGMVFHESQTLSPGSSPSSMSSINQTPSFVLSQASEGDLQIPHENMHIYPQPPPTPTSSFSNSEPSVSPPTLREREIKCPHPDCNFSPGGKGELSYLRKHLETHKPNRKKFHCSHCPKTFSRVDNRTSHEKKFHQIGGGGVIRQRRRVNRSPARLRRTRINRPLAITAQELRTL
ncbi:hypothetical protein F4777DRAFT_318519 [Nemania sp. FL0916]|nr:hypothetical protein F4777DRAFT_318519 [Nemania sp. FL0916]